MVTPILDWLGRRASPVLAAALFVGLALPGLAHLLRPLFAATIAVLLVSALLRIDLGAILGHVRRPAGVAAILAWILLGAPLAMWAVVSVIGPPASLASAIVLTASCPVLVAVPAFALMLRLDAALAFVLMVATSLLQPLVQPPLALLLLGIELEIGVLPLMLRLGAFVGGCYAAALVIRRLAGPARLERAKPAIDGIAVLALVVFGIGIMDGVTATLLARPGHVALFLAAAFLANFGLQAAGGLVFARMARVPALTAALASGNRNLGILLAVLGESASPDLALYLACGQFPMYLIPAVLGPVYARLRGGVG